MALEVPLVPINSDAKVFEASNALQEAINNLRFAQQAPGKPQQAKADQAEDKAAKRSATQQLLDERLQGQPGVPAEAGPATSNIALPFQAAPVGDVSITPSIGSMV
jgi:hypothetical protein